MKQEEAPARNENLGREADRSEQRIPIRNGRRKRKAGRRKKRPMLLEVIGLFSQGEFITVRGKYISDCQRDHFWPTPPCVVPRCRS